VSCIVIEIHFTLCFLIDMVIKMFWVKNASSFTFQLPQLFSEFVVMQFVNPLLR